MSHEKIFGTDGIRRKVSDFSMVAMLAQDMQAPAVIADLPTALQQELGQAALRADMMHVAQLIEEIRTHNAPLADALATLAHEFEYDKILALVKGDLDKPKVG